MQVDNQTRGRPLITHGELADTFWTRFRGLMGRSSLPEGGGLVLKGEKSIHTFFMKFPIDVAFLAGDGRVLTLHHGLKPNRLSRISLRAEGVLELAAGRLRATGTDVGDIIEFRDK